MLVKLQTRGRDILGLHVGKSNVRRYFPAAVRTVELELDHLGIQCELKPNFWSDRPQIADPRLCAWLAAKNSRRESGDMPIGVEMMRAGKASFRLQLVSSRPGKGGAAA